MYNPLKASTIERISAAQTPARPQTLEERLAMLNRMVELGLGSPDVTERRKEEIEQIEGYLESEKIIEIVQANAEHFREFRVAIALACLKAEEAYKPSEEQELDEWLQPDEIVARLDSFSVRSDGAWIPNASEDDGADDRPSTQMREHGPM